MNICEPRVTGKALAGFRDHPFLERVVDVMVEEKLPEREPLMIYTAEQHRKAARHLARRAKVEMDPDRKVVLKKAAHRHRLVVKAAMVIAARALARAAIAKAQQSASRKNAVDRPSDNQ